MIPETQNHTASWHICERFAASASYIVAWKYSCMSSRIHICPRT